LLIYFELKKEPFAANHPLTLSEVVVSFKKMIMASIFLRR